MRNSDEVAIEWFEGPRDELADLFALADDSLAAIESYHNLGRILVARYRETIIGHLQLVYGSGGGVELKSLAVREDRQGQGVGRRLVDHAVATCRDAGYSVLRVSTATADTRVLRFYQLAGFRMLRVERDAFTPKRGYESIDVDGIPLRDRVWLSLDL
jgi:GNAT superfamily N-acetyltransferase